MIWFSHVLARNCVSPAAPLCALPALAFHSSRIIVTTTFPFWSFRGLPFGSSLGTCSGILPAKGVIAGVTGGFPLAAFDPIKRLHACASAPFALHHGSDGLVFSSDSS